MKFDDFEYDVQSGIYVGRDKGTPAGYMDGAESYLKRILGDAADLGIFSPELKSAVKDWPSMYHLSPYRATILDCLDLRKRESRVLELGAGCGAVTRWLGESFQEIHAVEGNYHRAGVAKLRCRDLNNVKVYTGNFLDLEINSSFDIATLIGVLEYSHMYHPLYKGAPHKAALSTLQLVFKALKNKGALILAIENKFGLKYFSGSREDHTGKHFDGIQGYPRADSAFTFSAVEMEQLLESAGFSAVEFHLPFPDYKLASTVINGNELPSKYFLHNWIETPFPDRSAGNRSLLFNESLAVRELAKSNMLKDLANSFLIVAYKGERESVCEEIGLPEQKWVAKHYSLGRHSSFNKKVALIKSDENNLEVSNVPVVALNNDKSTCNNIFNHELTAENYYPGDQLLFNVFELFASDNFDKRFSGLIEKLISFLIEEYSVGRNDKNGIPLIRGEAFDVLFWNIIVEEGSGKWKVIDKEWSFRGALPVDFILWRNLFHLILRHNDYLKEPLNDRTMISFIIDNISKYYPSFNEDAYNRANRMEDIFHYYVSHGKLPEIKVLPVGEAAELPGDRSRFDNCDIYNNDVPLNVPAFMNNQADTQRKVSIIIPVFNNVKYTMQCLDALASNTGYVPYEVIVVDNGSTDGTKELLGTIKGDIKVLTNETNLGFAIASNQGAKVADGDYIVFLNNDTIPQTGWLEAMVREADGSGDIAIVGSKLLYPDDKIQHAGVVFSAREQGYSIYHIYRGVDKDHPAVNYRREYNAVTAACMLVRKNIFIDMGMFDEDFINGYEDVDFCLKVRESDYKIVYTPDSVVYHYEEKTEGRLSYGEHNTQQFLRRWNGKIKTDDYTKALEDGFRIEYLPGKGMKFCAVEWSDETKKLILEAVKSKEQYDYQRVIKLCNQVVEKDAANTYALQLMGEVHETLGNLEDAERCYSKLVSLDDSFETVYSLAIIKKGLNKFEEAILLFQKIIPSAPDGEAMEVHINMADCKTRLGKFDEGTDHYTKAIQINKEDERPYIGLAVIETRNKNSKAALDYYRRALEINPGSSKAIAGIGIIEFAEGNKEKAFARFKEALDISEDDITSLALLIQVSFELNTLSVAIIYIEKYLNFHPADMDILYKHAEICCELEKMEEAEESLQKILLFAPEREDALTLLKSIRGKRVMCKRNKSSAKCKEADTTEKGNNNMKKVAIVRGANLNKWEMQNYEPLMDRYDITAFTTTEGCFDTSQIKFPIEKLAFSSQGLLLHMEGLEDRLSGVDLVYSADITYEFSAQAVRAKAMHGCKVVCLEWENIPFNYEEHEVASNIKETVRNGADHFIAVTGRAKEALVLEGVPEERIDVVPMGIDISRFSPSESAGLDYRRRLNIDISEIVVLFIGRLVWEKGVIDLIHAAGRVLRDEELNSVPIRFLLAGNGQEIKPLRERAERLGISDRVIFLENTPYQDIHKLHNTADIFVLPSISTRTWQEQFGMVLIESMACGKPVISTYSGSIPEVVGDAGILVQPNDHMSLYLSIKRLLSDKSLRYDLAKKALNKARDEFDSIKVAEKVNDIFNKVLSGQTSSKTIVSFCDQGLKEWNEGEKERGLESVCNGFEKNPDNKEALDLIMQMGMEINRQDIIEKSLREYLMYHPANFDALNNLAEVLFKKESIEAAEDELKKVLLFDPDNARSLNMLGKMRAKTA